MLGELIETRDLAVGVEAEEGPVFWSAARRAAKGAADASARERAGDPLRRFILVLLYEQAHDGGIVPLAGPGERPEAEV
ncbi:MAG TPA: hypothetical protein VE093_18910, partial [Polyangiaceae bacterium]|nr:hypothetical protein [Polyangiaceae bacterium]